MADGMMQQLTDKIKKQYPTLTNQKGVVENYVYIVKNQEFLIDIGRSTRNNESALSGVITDIEHSHSGIAMMASSYNRANNNVYYIPTTKKKGAEIERELKQIEKNIKSIVLAHYDISDKNAGGTYVSGSTKNKDVSKLLKKFLYENLSADTLKDLNEPRFSFTELLDIVTEDGGSWHNIIKNQKAAQSACKLLGIKWQA